MYDDLNKKYKHKLFKYLFFAFISSPKQCCNYFFHFLSKSVSLFSKETAASLENWNMTHKKHAVQKKNLNQLHKHHSQFPVII